MHVVSDPNWRGAGASMTGVVPARMSWYHTIKGVQHEIGNAVGRTSLYCIQYIVRHVRADGMRASPTGAATGGAVRAQLVGPEGHSMIP